MTGLVSSIPSLDPGERLLCGPGPSNVHPKVLEAMGRPMNGHLDPDFWDVMVDCVTSLGGEEILPNAWNVDYAYSCSQKSLGCPPGLSPFSVSERGLGRIRNRKAPVSFSFDVDLLAKYWIDRPITYHHTMPI